MCCTRPAWPQQFCRGPQVAWPYHFAVRRSTVHDAMRNDIPNQVVKLHLHVMATAIRSSSGFVLDNGRRR